MASALPIELDPFDHPDARPRPFIPPSGFPFVQAPRVKLTRTAADVLDALLCWLKPGQTWTRITDVDLGTALYRLGRPCSLRFVQKGLNALEKAGLIARPKIDVGGRLVRQITLLYALAGGREKGRKSKSTNPIGGKKFGPPPARPCEGSPHARAILLESSREQEKDNRAGAADAGDGAPSSSPAGGGPDAAGGEAMPTPEELAEFFRSLARGVGDSKAVPPAPPRVPPPRGPRRGRPVEPDPGRDLEERPEEPPGEPIARGVWEARRAAIAAATADQLADLAAMGDRAAMAELNRRQRLEVEAARLASATRPAGDSEAVAEAQGPPPRVEPPEPKQPAVTPGRPEVRPRGRDSPDPPRRGIFARLFGRG